MNPRLRYLATTVALLAVGLGYALIQAKPWQRGPRLPARPAAASQLAPRPSVVHTARELLDHSEALGLTPAQKSQLEALDRKWDRDTARLRAALKDAEQEFARFVRGEAKKGASLQELQRRSEDFRELSAELRERRLIHAQAAAQVLNEAQRRALGLSSSINTAGGGQ